MDNPSFLNSNNEAIRSLTLLFNSLSPPLESEEIDHLSKLSNPWDILKATLYLEKQIYQLITSDLQKLDRDQPINKQLDQLQYTNTCFVALRHINSILINIAPQILYSFTLENSDLGKSISNFFQQIQKIPYVTNEALGMARQKDLKKPTEENEKKLLISAQNANLYLEKMHNSLLLCFLKGCAGPNGAKFIENFCSQFSKNSFDFELMIMEQLSSTGLEMAAKDTGCYAKFSEKELKVESVKDIFNIIQTGLKSGGGGSILLPCPVCFDTPEEYGSKAGKCLYFLTENNIDKSVWNLLNGAITFDKSGNPFYTPFHTVMLHEFAHGLHNLLGLNVMLMGSQCDSNEVLQWLKLWDNAEEFHATMISKFGCENGFNSDLGLPERCSHKALLEQEIMTPDAFKESMSLSLNQTSLHGQFDIHHYQSTTSFLLSSLMSKQEINELTIRKEKEPERKEDLSDLSEKEKHPPSLSQGTNVQTDQKDKKDDKKPEDNEGYKLNK